MVSIVELVIQNKRSQGNEKFCAQLSTELCYFVLRSHGFKSVEVGCLNNNSIFPTSAVRFNLILDKN